MQRTTPLLKFVFDYKRFHCRIPIVPVRFVRSDGVSSPIINAVLDSGADALTIPKELAEAKGWNKNTRLRFVEDLEGNIYLKEFAEGKMEKKR